MQCYLERAAAELLALDTKAAAARDIGLCDACTVSLSELRSATGRANSPPLPIKARLMGAYCQRRGGMPQSDPTT